MLRKRPLTFKKEEIVSALIKDLAYLNRMQKAASTLGTMGEEVIPALARALDSRSALGATLALGMTKSQKAVPHLIRALESKKNFLVRAQAADSLGEIISSKSVGPLMHALYKDKSIHVQIAAAASLGDMMEAGKLSLSQVFTVQLGVHKLLLPMMRVKPLSLCNEYISIIDEVRSKISDAKKKFRR